jgi:hypothetical protein
MQGSEHHDRANGRAGKICGHIHCDVGQPQDADIEHLPRCPHGFEIVAGKVTKTQVQALSDPGRFDDICLPIQLVSYRGPDEIRPI